MKKMSKKARNLNVCKTESKPLFEDFELSPNKGETCRGSD